MCAPRKSNMLVLHQHDVVTITNFPIYGINSSIHWRSVGDNLSEKKMGEPNIHKYEMGKGCQT